MSDMESLREESCIFCRIVAGEVPAHKVYEDDRLVSFLDIGPLSEGHLLVVPKAHYVTIDEMPGDLAASCMAVVPMLSRALRDATGAQAWNLLQNNGREAGQLVEHVHFHLIPRRGDEGLDINWPAGKLDPDKADDLQQRIRAAI